MNACDDFGKGHDLDNDKTILTLNRVIVNSLTVPCLGVLSAALWFMAGHERLPLVSCAASFCALTSAGGAHFTCKYLTRQQGKSHNVWLLYLILGLGVISALIAPIGWALLRFVS